MVCLDCYERIEGGKPYVEFHAGLMDGTEPRFTGVVFHVTCKPVKKYVTVEDCVGGFEG